MTRHEILQAAHASFNEFFHIWQYNKRDQGLGALVFMPEEAAGGEELHCEFWTLKEILRFVRRTHRSEEFLYRSLETANRTGGYPILFLPPGSAPDGENYPLFDLELEQVAEAFEA